MAAFPRTLIPSKVTYPKVPGPMAALGHSNKAQLRGVGALGRRWTETYPPFKMDATGRAFLAYVSGAWARGTLFDIEHYLLLTKNGGMSGAPTVNGSSQTGSALAINNCAGSNPVFKAGDIFTLPSFNVVFDVTEDAPNLSAGGCTIKIWPPIPAGQSPANGALLTYAAPVRFKQVYIAEQPQWPDVKSDEYIGNFTLTFQEQP